MAYITTDYRLSVGHNNAGGLTAITSITDGTTTLKEPFGLGGINRGQRIILTNGMTSRIGKPRAVWISPMLISQYWYVVNTYVGLVTVRLAYGGTSFANYNAVLELSDPDELEYLSFANSSFLGPGFRAVQWTYTRLDAL